MRQGIKNAQKQKQGLNVSAQQLQLLAFMHLSTQELEQRIDEALLDNPALERVELVPAASAEEGLPQSQKDELDERESWTDTFLDKDEFNDSDGFFDYSPSSGGGFNDALLKDDSTAADFRAKMHEQLSFLPLSEQDNMVCAHLIDSLDPDGYLRTPLEDICDDISFANHIFIQDEAIEQNLHCIQQLEPAGVAARNVCECLSLQLRRPPFIDNEAASLAIKIVQDGLELLAGKKLGDLCELTNAELDNVKAAVALITQLQPYPVGAAFAGANNETYLYPDFIVQYADDGSLEVYLANAKHGMLRVNERALKQVKAQRQSNKKNAQAKAYVRYLQSTVAAAKELIDMVQQRELNMQSVIQAVVSLQEAYFSSGDPNLIKPMIIKDISEIAGLDAATISRVSSNKYIQTPFGIVKLKDLFNQGIAMQDGSAVNVNELQQSILKLVEQEDKNNPLSDQDIAENLNSKGYLVARRTVAKYRALMHIPSAKQRQL